MLTCAYILVRHLFLYSIERVIRIKYKFVLRNRFERRWNTYTILLRAINKNFILRRNHIKQYLFFHLKLKNARKKKCPILLTNEMNVMPIYLSLIVIFIFSTNFWIACCWASIYRCLRSCLYCSIRSFSNIGSVWISSQRRDDRFAGVNLFNRLCLAK